MKAARKDETNYESSKEDETNDIPKAGMEGETYEGDCDQNNNEDKPKTDQSYKK